MIKLDCKFAGSTTKWQFFIDFSHEIFTKTHHLNNSSIKWSEPEINH